MLCEFAGEVVVELLVWSVEVPVLDVPVPAVWATIHVAPSNSTHINSSRFMVKLLRELSRVFAVRLLVDSAVRTIKTGSVCPKNHKIESGSSWRTRPQVAGASIHSAGDRI